MGNLVPRVSALPVRRDPGNEVGKWAPQTAKGKLRVVELY